MLLRMRLPLLTRAGIRAAEHCSRQLRFCMGRSLTDPSLALWQARILNMANPVRLCIVGDGWR